MCYSHPHRTLRVPGFNYQCSNTMQFGAPQQPKKPRGARKQGYPDDVASTIFLKAWLFRVCAKPRLVYLRHVNDRAIPFSCTTCIRALRRPPRTNFLMMSPPRPSPRHTHAEQCCPASFSWRGLRRRRSTTRRSSGARRSSTETLVTSASKTPTSCS